MGTAIDKLSGEVQGELQRRVAQVFEITTGEAYKRLQSMTADKVNAMVATIVNAETKAVDESMNFGESMELIRSVCKEDWAAKAGVFEEFDVDQGGNAPAPTPEVDDPVVE